MTLGAERDLMEINDYGAWHDAPAKADALLKWLERVIEGLASFAERGAYPAELLALGIKDFGQTFFKSYGVIYRVIRAKVHIVMIADSRRDLQALLARRLLGG